MIEIKITIEDNKKSIDTIIKSSSGDGNLQEGIVFGILQVYLDVFRKKLDRMQPINKEEI